MNRRKQSKLFDEFEESDTSVSNWHPAESQQGLFGEKKQVRELDFDEWKHNMVVELAKRIDLPMEVANRNLYFLRSGLCRIEFREHYGTRYCIFEKATENTGMGAPKLVWTRVGNPISTSDIDAIARKFKRFVLQESL